MTAGSAPLGDDRARSGRVSDARGHRPARPDPALRLRDVTVWEWDDRLRRRQPILTGVDWSVGPGEQWALLGPNGAGKSTLLDVAAGMRHPSRGSVEILGETVGRTDLRTLRERIGHVDVKTEEAFSPRRTAREVVLTGATGTIQVIGERLLAADHGRAAQLLSQFGCAAIAEHSFASCSQGERRRILLARAMMRHPPLLLLDEPGDGLDLPGREALLAALTFLAVEQPAPAMLLVTHHLEELPPTITHALLLADGRVSACGPAPAVLAAGPLSACFGVSVSVSRAGGRWAARATASW
jgi:iron complex transport system ATP-binding protein